LRHDVVVTETADTNALSASLAEMFPSIPLQSVVRCVWDAESAVEYAAVDSDDRKSLVERLARAHLEELLPFYTDEQPEG
jgi:hypothetical protein